MAVTEEDIKQLIVDVLQLEDITPADIDAQAPLFVEGLALDSIDALELGVALQKRYGIILSANDFGASRPEGRNLSVARQHVT